MVHFCPFSTSCLSDITGYLSFCDWGPSLSMISARFICVVAKDSIEFISIYGWVRVHCIWVPLMHPSVHGHFCCLPVLVIADYSVVNIGFTRCFHLLFGNQGFSLHIVSGVWLWDPSVENDLYLYLFSLRVRPWNLCHCGSCTFPFPKRLLDGSLSPRPYSALILCCIFPVLLSDGCEVSDWDFHPSLPNACFSCALAKSPPQELILPAYHSPLEICFMNGVLC